MESNSHTLNYGSTFNSNIYLSQSWQENKYWPDALVRYGGEKQFAQFCFCFGSILFFWYWLWSLRINITFKFHILFWKTNKTLRLWYFLSKIIVIKCRLLFSLVVHITDEYTHGRVLTSHRHGCIDSALQTVGLDVVTHTRPAFGYGATALCGWPESSVCVYRLLHKVFFYIILFYFLFFYYTASLPFYGISLRWCILFV
jgi:hypothetical protein